MVECKNCHKRFPRTELDRSRLCKSCRQKIEEEEREKIKKVKEEEEEKDKQETQTISHLSTRFASIQTEKTKEKGMSNTKDDEFEI